MLDNVERRRLPVDPARKDPPPVRVRLLHVHLDEGAGQLLTLPRRSGLAGPKAHDDVVPAGRLAGLQPDVADDAVALVEEPEDRDAIRHRGHARMLAAAAGRALRRSSVRLLGGLVLLPAAAVGQERPKRSAH
jgi:hypothetical protein